MREDARVEAQKQWNTTPCGQVGGNADTLEYFRDVAAARNLQQPWTGSYFDYDRFRGREVLEIGVGHGTDLLRFARGGAVCHGVDITDRHLALTQRNFELHGLKVDLHKSDATRLPFDDESLDCVYSFGVLHHIPEIEAVIAEVRRVLRPGGTLMVAVYYKWSAFHLFSKLIGDGIAKLWLLRKGYAGLLSTIEEGSDGVRIKPYVRLYSKAEIRWLLRGFAVEDVSVHQLVGEHFWRLKPLFGWAVEPLQKRLGWYVAFKATKPRVAREEQVELPPSV